MSKIILNNDTIFNQDVLLPDLEPCTPKKQNPLLAYSYSNPGSLTKNQHHNPQYQQFMNQSPVQKNVNAFQQNSAFKQQPILYYNNINIINRSPNFKNMSYQTQQSQLQDFQQQPPEYQLGYIFGERPLINQHPQNDFLSQKHYYQQNQKPQLPNSQQTKQYNIQQQHYQNSTHNHYIHNHRQQQPQQSHEEQAYQNYGVQSQQSKNQNSRGHIHKSFENDYEIHMNNQYKQKILQSSHNSIGELCGPECNCFDCFNSNQSKDHRYEAINSIIEKNQEAFSSKILQDKKGKQLHKKGCNCRRSNCLKKYCECYQSGVKCGDYCKCDDCKNMDKCSSTLKKKYCNMPINNALISHPLQETIKKQALQKQFEQEFAYENFPENDTMLKTPVINRRQQQQYSQQHQQYSSDNQIDQHYDQIINRDRIDDLQTMKKQTQVGISNTANNNNQRNNDTLQKNINLNSNNLYNNTNNNNLSSSFSKCQENNEISNSNNDKSYCSNDSPQLNNNNNKFPEQKNNINNNFQSFFDIQVKK